MHFNKLGNTQQATRDIAVLLDAWMDKLLKVEEGKHQKEAYHENC